MIEKFKTILASKNSKILLQNPGNSTLLKKLITYLDISLIPLIPNTLKLTNDFRRKSHIVKNVIYIIEEIPINTIWIRNAISDEKRTHGNDKSNVAFHNIETFNYWKLPIYTFDILISETPTRLEMVKADGLTLNEQWFIDNAEALKPFTIYPYRNYAPPTENFGRKYYKYKLKIKK